MKNILKKILIIVLEFEAKYILKKYKPKIVAVIGSVGKTSTKDMIYEIMYQSFYVYKSYKNFNNEMGVSFTILNCQNTNLKIKTWLENIVKGLDLMFLPNHYPEWLVLEIGANKPGDIKNISKWLEPDILVVTRLSKVPVHVEFFESPEDLLKEKASMVKALKKGGTLILNADDEDVISFKNFTEEKIFTFSIEKSADLVASHPSISYNNDIPIGTSFRVDYKGNSVPVFLSKSIGINTYHALAGMAVGITQGLNIVNMTESLSNYVPPPGRMNLLEGILDSIIIDDTYNSSPVALNEALTILGEIDTKNKKIAILGDMLELGKYSVSEHKKIGEFAKKVCDILIVVGVRAKDIMQGAIESGMSKENIFEFENSTEAGKFVKTIIKKNDVILVKGSQLMRMERVVENIMLHPEEKKTLLVRQEDHWKDK